MAMTFWIPDHTDPYGLGISGMTNKNIKHSARSWAKRRPDRK